MSVVIPTYNRAVAIGRALDSVFNQTVAPLEVIVVDDGSTDNTEELIRSAWGDRVKYHQQENQGACVARNTGAKMAKGDYVAYLDSDDEWMPEKLEKQLEFFQASDDPKLGVVLCAGRSIYPDRDFPDTSWPEMQGESFDLLMELGAIRGLKGKRTSNFMVHRKVFEAGVFFDPGQPALQDYEFLIAVSKQFTIRTVPDVLVIKHHEEGGDHIYSGDRIIQGRKRLLEKYADDLKAMPIALSNHHRGLAFAFFQRRQRAEMRKHLAEAKKANPKMSTTLWMVMANLNFRSFTLAARLHSRANRVLRRMHLPLVPGPFNQRGMLWSA